MPAVKLRRKQAAPADFPPLAPPPVDHDGPLDLDLFYQRHGRFPRIGDRPAPWHWRGWLLRYVVMAHACHPEVPDRWGYLFRTLEAGRLLDEPIPQIQFGQPDRKVFSLIAEWSRLIGWDCGGWSDFRSLVDWLGWALQVSDLEPKIADDKQEKLYRAVNVEPLLLAPYDYWGDYICELRGKGNSSTGFFPTPHSLVELMTSMTFGDASQENRDTRLLSVCDPCLGTGRMLLHASNYSLCLFGADIDPLVLGCCKISAALYAPWLAFPLPTSIVSRPGDAAMVQARKDAGHDDGELPVYRTDKKGQGLLFEP